MISFYCDFTMKHMEAELKQAFEKVTSKNCEEIIKKIRDIEDDFWKTDAILDQSQ